MVDSVQRGALIRQKLQGKYAPGKWHGNVKVELVSSERCCESASVIICSEQIMKPFVCYLRLFFFNQKAIQKHARQLRNNWKKNLR